MFHSITRKAFAVVVALLVACSFVGAPVVAAAGSGTGLDTLSDRDGAADDSTADDEEEEADDGDGDQEEGDDGTSGGEEQDGVDDEGGADDESSAEDGDEATADGGEANPDEDERVTGTVVDTADDLEGAVDDLDETADGLGATTDDAVDAVDGTENVSTHDVDTLGAFALGDLSLLDLVGSLDIYAAEGDPATWTDATGVDAPEADGEYGPAPAESLEVRSDERAPDAAGDREDEDGSPAPSDPGGGVVAFGAVATAAALRGGPVVPGGRGASGGWLSTLLDRVRPFVLPLRYSRYDDSDPLEHEARERVYEIVNETPGSYLSEVSDEADLPLSTTRHHIRVLEREDLVTGAKIHGKRRFYPAYAEGVELAAALNDDSTATIIQAIARLGAASVSDLADELGRDPSTVSHHLQRLEADGIVTRERDGRAVVNRLSAEARTALEPESTPEVGESSELVAGGAD